MGISVSIVQVLELRERKLDQEEMLSEFDKKVKDLSSNYSTLQSTEKVCMNSICICMYVYMYVCIYVCICMYMYVYVCIHVCTDVYVDQSDSKSISVAAALTAKLRHDERLAAIPLCT